MQNELLDHFEEEAESTFAENSFSIFIAGIILFFGLTIFNLIFGGQHISYNWWSLLSFFFFAYLQIIGTWNGFQSFKVKEKGFFKKWIAIVGNLFMLSIFTIQLLDILLNFYL